MSTPSQTALAEVASEAVERSSIVKPVQAAGFWAAIALPFLYVPLVVSGPTTSAEQTALAGLVALHVVSLLLGHRHQLD